MRLDEDRPRQAREASEIEVASIRLAPSRTMGTKGTTGRAGAGGNAAEVERGQQQVAEGRRAQGTPVTVRPEVFARHRHQLQQQRADRGDNGARTQVSVNGGKYIPCTLELRGGLLLRDACPSFIASTSQSALSSPPRLDRSRLDTVGQKESACSCNHSRHSWTHIRLFFGRVPPTFIGVWGTHGPSQLDLPRSIHKAQSLPHQSPS
jgi:hypothetical protein